MANSQNQILNKDAFSNGQIDSKIWLCEELENLFDKIDTIEIYGGWYGLTAFLLFSRNNIKLQKIRSYDIDPSCESIADMINENWVIKDWKFKAFTKDCNKHKSNADLVINTSTEHFKTKTWFKNIPAGTYVVLQGNNMPHDDHYNCAEDLDDFVAKYLLSQILFKGEKSFVYPDWQFKRYMIIGQK
jgi:hypothetical protein